MNKITIRSISALLLLSTILMLIACPMPEAAPSNWPADWSTISEAERQSYFRRLTPAALDGFVAAGWNVNQNLDNGVLGRDALPIHLAARYGASSEVIGWLVAEGRNDVNARIDRTSPLGGYAHYSALHFAVISNNLETVNALISAGATKNIVSTRSHTPFSLAVTRRGTSLDILKAVVYQGSASTSSYAYGGRSNISTNFCDMNPTICSPGHCSQISPLFLAAEQGRVELFKVLLELAGAGVNNYRPNNSEVDCNGTHYTLLTLIYQNPAQYQDAIVQALLASPALNVDKPIGRNALRQPSWTALHLAIDRAAQAGNVGTLSVARARLLVAKNPNLSKIADTRFRKDMGSQMDEKPCEMLSRYEMDRDNYPNYPAEMRRILMNCPGN